MKKIKRGRGRLKELCRLLTVNIKYLLIVTAGFVLFCICSLYMDGNDKFSGNYVKRPGVGEYDAEMEVVVEGLTDDAQRIELPISKRMYSDEEADEALAKGIEELVVIMQADNPSLQNVATGLNLVSELEELGLTVKWNLGESEIIDILGNVDNENLTENVDIEIEAILSDGKHSKNYIIPVRVVPRAYSESDRLLQRFLEFIKRIDKSEIQHDGYALPDSFEGRQIIYKNAGKKSFHFIWIIGIIIAVLLFVRERQETRTKMESRQKELIKDYPDIVSKLIVFIGAGLSIRQAWESIVSDYESEAAAGRERRYAYEEMATALTRLKTGAHESLVYKEFGRMCGLRQYMKLSSLLEQNRRTGLANLKTLLSMESQSAWEERINLAKREGEELSTKLLMPLFIMLGIVMMMIIVPAILTFY